MSDVVLARDPETGRFRPGHTGLGGRPARDKETRRKMRSLAIVLRDQWPAEQIAWWLREVAAGRDPDRPGAPATIDWSIRMRAAKMYLERALGMPAQSIHVDVDAELRAADAPELPPPEAFDRLDGPARIALREGLAKLLAQRPPDPDVSEGPGPRGAWNRHVRARTGPVHHHDHQTSEHDE